MKLKSDKINAAIQINVCGINLDLDLQLKHVELLKLGFVQSRGLAPSAKMDDFKKESLEI